MSFLEFASEYQAELLLSLSGVLILAFPPLRHILLKLLVTLRPQYGPVVRLFSSVRIAPSESSPSPVDGGSRSPPVPPVQDTPLPNGSPLAIPTAGNLRE